MRNSDADIAIDVLNKLIAQELEAASAGMRFGNRPLEESGLRRLLGLQEGRPVLRLETCERRGQGAGKMSYNVVTTEGIRTFENIDDAGDYAQAMSLRTGEPVKVFNADGLVAFTVRPTTKDTK